MYKKERNYLKKKIANMQNLSQNEFNQIEKMRGLLRDELEQNAKIKIIKNYEDMKKKERRFNNISFKIKRQHN